MQRYKWFYNLVVCHIVMQLAVTRELSAAVNALRCKRRRRGPLLSQHRMLCSFVYFSRVVVLLVTIGGTSFAIHYMFCIMHSMCNTSSPPRCNATASTPSAPLPQRWPGHGTASLSTRTRVDLFQAVLASGGWLGWLPATTPVPLQHL
jgi:hypothetical protein